jgi:hypothetical protein
MAKRQSTRSRRHGSEAGNPTIDPASRAAPAPEAPFPATADHKITVAKHIVQAVVAASDSGALEGENYDVHWPLSLVVQLLEQASDQLDKQAVRS